MGNVKRKRKILIALIVVAVAILLYSIYIAFFSGMLPNPILIPLPILPHSIPLGCLLISVLTINPSYRISL